MDVSGSDDEQEELVRITAALRHLVAQPIPKTLRAYPRLNARGSVSAFYPRREGGGAKLRQPTGLLNSLIDRHFHPTGGISAASTSQM